MATGFHVNPIHANCIPVKQMNMVLMWVRWRHPHQPELEYHTAETYGSLYDDNERNDNELIII